MVDRLGWWLLGALLRLWRYLAVLILGVGLALGAGTVPAQAYCVGSSICNPANAPILAELATGAAGAAPVTTGAAATGSAITAPIATQAATTAGGSTIAAEVWGGVAAVALSAAGWLGAKAFLGEGDLPPDLMPDPALGVGLSQGVSVREYAGANRRTAILPTTVVYSGTYGGPYVPVTVSYPATPGIVPLQPETWASSTIQFQGKCQTTDLWKPASDGIAFTAALIRTGYTFTVNMTIACLRELQVRVPTEFNSSGTPIQWTPWTDVPIPGAPGGAQQMMLLETELDCTGSPVQVFQSATFSEVPTSGVVLPQRLCPNGERLQSVKVTLRVLTDSSLDKVLIDVVIPKYLQELVPKRCLEVGTDDCTLDLRANGKSVVGNPAHAAWETQPKGNEYTCHYGGRLVDIKFCRAKYGSNPRVKEPVPIDEPLPTKEPLPYPETAPPFDPVPVPEPTPGPGSDSCMRWSLGDILTGVIVFRAVGCAVEWAFVPPPGTFEATQAAMSASAQASGPMVFLAEVGAIVGDTSDGLAGMMQGNCLGPSVTLPNYEDPIRPLNACDPPVSTVAGWTRLGSTIVFAALGLLAAARIVLASLNIATPWGKSDTEAVQA
jgi:hypothetical protein